MKLLPIKLGIAKKSGNTQKSEKNGPAKSLNDIKPKILERDKNTCRFCAFEAKKYQEILVINYNEQDLRPQNLVTSCIFCHQCFHLDKVSSMRSGALIWCPELTQAQINQVTKSVYIARISQGPMADAARKSLDTLMSRREDVKTRLGTDDPYILSTVLRDYLTDKNYKARTEKLEGVRLLPLDRRIIKEGDLEFNQFPQILAYWRSKDGPFGAIPPNKWIESFAQKFAA